MQEYEPIHAPEMIRIPGLYRSWELPELLEPGRQYRIEGAGFHEDGTPLLAVYADEAGPCDASVTPTAVLRSREHGSPLGTISHRPE